MKKYFNVILFVCIVLIVSYFLIVNQRQDVFKGKLLEIELYENEVRNYTILKDERFELWYNEEAKEKLLYHMKENNLNIEAGKYEFFQDSTYEDILRIFKFK